jgi:four helix bundle protein
MSSVKSYRDLEIWQKAMDLVVEIYKLTQNLPRHETYGMISQMQRAAVSIPANVAEGKGRQSLKEFIQFLSIANGSLTELETYIMVAERLRYITTEQRNLLLNRTDEIARMISGLQKSLHTKIK